jgi:hypothetical protein
MMVARPVTILFDVCGAVRGLIALLSVFRSACCHRFAICVAICVTHCLAIAFADPATVRWRAGPYKDS